MRSLCSFALPVLVFVTACGGGSPPTSSPSESNAASKTPPAVATAERSTDAGAEPTTPAPATPPPAKAAAVPVVKILEPGEAPRRALRYRFKQGTSDRAELDMTMAMAMTMNGKGSPKTSLPTMRTLMKLEAKELTPEGDMRITFDTEKVTVLADKPLERAPACRAREGALRPRRHARIVAALAPRRRVGRLVRDPAAREPEPHLAARCDA
jgi:hypothetical protein